MRGRGARSDVTPLVLLVGPIDVDEVLADIRRDLTDFGVVLGVCFERFICDVLVELPHIAGPEELPWRKFVDEHVTIS